MRRSICSLIVLLLVLSSSVVYAGESVTPGNESEILYSEADIILLCESATEEQLEEQGFTADEVKELKSIDVKKCFLERGTLSPDELKQMGYDDEQIQILKEYDGSEIDENSEILRAASKIIATYSAYSCSRSKIGVRIDWTWDTPPIIRVSGLNDTVALKWKTWCKDIGDGEAKVSDAHGIIRYYSDDTACVEKELVRVNNYNDSIIDESVAISFLLLDSDKKMWAKKGALYVTVVPTITNSQFDHITVKGSYGYNYLSATDLGFQVGDDGLSLTFTPTKASTTYNFKTAYVYYDGKLKLAG